MKNRITITIYGNETMIGIHTKTVMNVDPYGSQGKARSKRLDVFTRQLNAVHGVERADVRKYEVSVEKADSFDWNEVVPTLIPIVAKFCRYDIFELRIEDQRPTHNYDEDGYVATRMDRPSVDLGVFPHDPYEQPTFSGAVAA